MDNVVDGLTNAYQEFITAAVELLEAKEAAKGERTTATDAALDNFKKKWETFKAGCDQAHELVDSLKQTITANTSYPVNQDLIDIFDDSVADDYPVADDYDNGKIN